MKKIIFLFFTLACFIISADIYASIQPINTAKLISGEQTLVVGHIDFPPFYLKDGHGLDADVLNAVAKREGIKKIKFVTFTSLTELFHALNKGKINIIVNGILQSPERSQQYFLTKPYYLHGGSGFLYLKGHGNFTILDDVNGHKVGVLAGSYSQAWLATEKKSPSAIKTYDSLNQLLSALKNKQIDVAMSNYTVFRYQQEQSKGQLQAVLIKQNPIVFALRKQDKEFGEKLNHIINDMWSDGSLNAIKVKYLKPLGITPAQHE